MKTTREYITITEDGHELRFVGTYVSQMAVDPLWYNYPAAPKDYIDTHGSKLTVYLDGQRIKKSEFPEHWGLVENKMRGVMQIEAFPIGFSNPEKIKEYRDFLVDLMQDDEKVKAAKVKRAAKAAEEELEHCREIVRLCELGYLVETAQDARTKRRNWNIVNNEGGDGYVPTWYTREQYERARAIVNAAK